MPDGRGARIGDMDAEALRDSSRLIHSHGRESVTDTLERIAGCGGGRTHQTESRGSGEATDRSEVSQTCCGENDMESRGGPGLPDVCRR
jgi:hypothetical protein